MTHLSLGECAGTSHASPTNAQSAFTDMAESPPKQSMRAGKPGGKPPTAAKQPANVLDENHSEESPSSTVSNSDQFRPGKLFATFELHSEVESGSTGTVWLAQDYSVRHRVDQVALKFLPDAIVSDKTAAEKLKNEVRRRVTLEHPNILRVYDLVEQKGRIAIQMEYLDGQSLSRLRLTRPNHIFEVRELEKWMKGLCGALEYAHKDAGLFDSGISPGHLIVDVAGNLKLKDIGITNCITDSMRRLMVLQDTSETLPYQSPQRAAGEEPAITDDLYSLGAILYECLTGKPPFYAGDIGIQISEKVPPSMTERRAELGIEGEAIPKNWEETVAACLAKDPAQRPQSASEVENRLQYPLSRSDSPAGSTVGSAPHGIEKPPTPVRRSRTRNPWLVMLGVIFILAVGSAIAFFVFRQWTGPKVGKIVSNTMVPERQPSPAPTVPPSSSRSAGKENPLSGTTPSAEVKSTPSPEVSSTPSAEVKSTPSAEVSPTPSAEVSSTPSVNVSPTPSEQVVTTPNERQSASTSPSPTALSQNEIDATKEEVIKRINALPGVTAEKKANLIEKMNKARSMERLIVIPFEPGRTALRRVAMEELVKSFDSPGLRDKVSDPTIVLVVAGYADVGGRPDKNLRISQERAENVSKILKEQAKLLNAMQTIGMGGTVLLDSNRPEQNRAVEIWAVVPF
jgi:serine/threonine protein kinase